MIKGTELQNRAEGIPASEPTKDEARVRLRALLARIDEARVVKDGEERHCVDCFRRGRDAALKIIDGA